MNPQKTDIFCLPYVPGIARGTLQHGLSSVTNDHIVIVSQDEISSIDTLPAGFIVIDGAPFSHTLIRLLGMGVPTVIVPTQHATKLKEGQEVKLDGVRGHITSDLSIHTEEVYQLPAIQPDQRLTTADGVRVHLLASVRNKDTARQAVLTFAEAIGLVRSEFLIPEQDQVPDERFYQQAFTDLCEAAASLNVTFRLLDVSADKMPTWLAQLDAGGGVLGLQGTRLYGMPTVQAVIEAQLSAIKSLSERFALRVLIPYLVRHEELTYWSEQIRQQLPEAIPIGAMVETPASALDMHNWFDSADFVAIGCNDLMQCLFAADRDCASLRHYLDPYAPLLFRFLRQIAENAKANLQHVQLCGVLSQLPGLLPILLGLGYRTFSIESVFVPYLAQTVQATNINEAEELATRVCAAKTSHQVLEFLDLPTEHHRSFLYPEEY